MNKKKRRVWKTILYILLIIAIMWFILVIVEFLRVRNDKKPLVCINYHKVVEDDDEYAYTCNGLLYKYKEYYYKIDDTMSARELTMFFTDFVRDENKGFK